MKNIPGSAWVAIGCLMICVSIYLIMKKVPALEHSYNKAFIYGNITGYAICAAAGIFLIIRGMRKR